MHAPQPLRLLSLCSSHSMGGLECFQLAVASSMRERGHHVEIVGEPKRPFTRAAEEAGFTTHQVRFRRYISPLAVLRLAYLMKRRRADVLHYALSKDIWTVAPAARLAGLTGRIVHTLGMNPGGRLDNPIHRWLRNTLGAFVAPTPQAAESAATVWGMTPEEVTLIPNYVDARPFEAEGLDEAARRMRRAWGFPPGALVVGMLGRLEPHKGLETFLRMAIELHRHPRADEPRFVVGGPASPGMAAWLADMMELAGGGGLADRIVFPGMQHEVPAFMHALDILVFPSHRETFGLVLVEAMLAGLPVVAASGPGPDYILDGGRFGALFPVRDHIRLAELVRELLSDAALRADRASAARQRALDAFSHSAVVPRFESLFMRLRDAGGIRRPPGMDKPA